MQRTMICVMAAAIAACGVEGNGTTVQAVAGPSVTVTQRSDGLAVSWTSLSVASYNVARDGLPIAMVNAPTTSYVDTALVAGATYCYAVAGVFDDGSTTPASSPVCAAAGGATASTKTLIVPLPRPAPDGRLTSLYAVVSGLDSNSATGPQDVYAQLPLEVGVTIRGLRMRVQDGGGGTKLQMALMSQTDGAEQLALVATSPTSSGSGHEETIAIPSLSIVTAPATQYIVKAYNASGIFVSTVYRLEVDHN